MKIKFKSIYVLVIKSFLEFTIVLCATQPAEGAAEAIKQANITTTFLNFPNGAT